MQFDKPTLEKGLGNALVRAYIMRDFVLPLKGYTLKELVGNQSTDLPLEYKSDEDFLKVIDQGEEIMTYPVSGPLTTQMNMVIFHLYGDRPIQEITFPTKREGSKVFNSLDALRKQEDPIFLNILTVFSFGFSIGEESNVIIPSDTIRETYGADDELSLPAITISSCSPWCLQIGLSDYMTREKTPSIQILGLLADPNIDPEEKKARLLNEFNVNIDRSMTEDYEYLSHLEDSEK